MKKADDRVSFHVRRRDGRCLVFGCGVRAISQLDAHHIMPRRYHRIRFDPDNLVSLCREHHRMAHAERAAFHELIEELLPGRLEHLTYMREHAGKVDLELVLQTFAGARAA
jgi:hypothetical protein